jgi:hypothetical protein
MVLHGKNGIFLTGQIPIPGTADNIVASTNPIRGAPTAGISSTKDVSHIRRNFN